MYSRGYKKRAIAEKIFETLAIFSCSLQCCFSVFSFFLAQQICMWEDLFLHTGYSGHHRRLEITPYLGLDFFYKMPGQNKTKGNKKLLIAKKARIRACPEMEVTRTAMADCLGDQGRLGHQGRLGC